MFSQPERNIPTHPTHCQAQGEHRDWNSDHILVHRSLPSPKIPITNHSFVETKPSLNNSRLTQFLNINMENAPTQRWVQNGVKKCITIIIAQILQQTEDINTLEIRSSLHCTADNAGS